MPPGPAGAAEGASSTTLGAILRDERLRAGAAPWIVALLAIANVLVAVWNRDLEAQRRANMLLDASPPSAAHASGPARAPRFDRSVGEQLEAFWKEVPDARRHGLVLVSGMSQMYAINDAKPGDQTIVEWMDDALAPEGVRAFGLAAPNLHNEEALVYLVAATSAPETTPDVFAYGVCFDKFRNVDVRAGLLRFLRSRPAARAAWARVCDGREAAYPMACAKMKATLEDNREAGAAKDAPGRAEVTVEGRLRRAASSVLPMVDARQNLNVALQLQATYLRNWVFRIKPTSKRPIIRSRYELNKQFLALMVDVAQANGVTIVLYVNPLNPQADNPYVPAEYAEFKQWLAGLAAEKNVPFANLEDVVPEQAWGEFLGGPDFKHFRGEGHKATSAALLERFGAVMRSAARRRTAP